MRKNNIKGSLILILAALIWGLAFVAQSSAADKIPTFAINGLRSIISAIFLFAFLQIRSIITRKKFKFVPEGCDLKTLIKSSVICGLMLGISVNLQQAGIAYYPKEAASEARAGFITALYVILVPIFSVITGKKIHALIWAAVGVAIVGVYLLCFSGDVAQIYLADVLIFLCAISFSIHILAVDKFCEKIGGVRLSMLQFAFCGVVSMLISLIFEFGSFTANDIICAAPQILYLGIMSSGVAYTLQIVGQLYAEPAVASISMSFESVFAALGGWVISQNKLSPTQIFGCLLVFAAIIIAQTPSFSKRRV